MIYIHSSEVSFSLPGDYSHTHKIISHEPVETPNPSVAGNLIQIAWQ
jgi:hypothetical protein